MRNHPIICLVAAPLLVCSCEISSIARSGPAPNPTEVLRSDEGFPTEAVFCADVPGTVRIQGHGFSPMPVDTLTDSQGLALPQVSLVAEDGSEIELSGVGYHPEDGTLSADVPGGLATGTYAISVTNPNEHQGNLAGALVVVPPPEVTGIDPDSILNGTDSAVVVLGNQFRKASDDTEPRVSITIQDGDSPVPLSGVAWQSPSEIDATVPAGLTAGLYDVTVTNPEGCSHTAAGILQIREDSLVFCEQDPIVPRFGWRLSRTRIEICADNTQGVRMLPTPEIFIVIDGEQIPLRRQAFLSGNQDGDAISIVSAVVPSQDDDARIKVGVFDILVRNPDGAVGVLEQAFEVLEDPPPTILEVTPARGDKNTTVTMTVIGEQFKKGTAQEDGVLIIELVPETGEPFACGDVTVASDDPEVGQQTATCEMELPETTGGYLVRVTHTDDGSFDLFASFAVTEPSRKLAQHPTALESLRVPRRAHGTAIGLDDLGNRFIWAVGGENGPAATNSVASIEVANVSRFGRLGQWTVLPVELPAPRTGPAVTRAANYVYVIGGSTDGSEPVAANTVLRFRILGADTAPVLDPLEKTAGTSSLAPGMYYYRVAAMMKDDDSDNPGGETLASDQDSMRVADEQTITVSWSVDDEAAVKGYRIYRTPAPDMLLGQEVLLHEITDGSETTFVDDGTIAPPDSDLETAKRPIPVGSLGEPVAMVELETPRFDAAATAIRVDADTLFLYVAGGRAGPLQADVLASVEWVALSGDGKTMHTANWQAGDALGLARAEHNLVPYSPILAPSAGGHFGLAAVGGTAGARAQTGTGLASVELSVIASDVGTPGAWSQNATAISTRVGLASIIVNDHLYAFAGWAGSAIGNFASDSDFREIGCVGAPTCQPTIIAGGGNAVISFGDFTSVRYRSSLVFFGAYFFFIGGSSAVDPATASTVVIRGSY